MTSDGAHYKHMEDKIGSSRLHELDEEDEALSFCDIPIYSDASADCCTSSAKYNVTNNSSSKEDNFFEFFSSGFSSSSYQPNSFIFCGKLIPSSSQRKAGLIHWKPDRTNHGRLSRISSTNDRGWYKVLFGSIRLPGEMELADIKSRQRRRRKSKPVFGMYENDERKTLGERSSANGFIGLVRSLSCRCHRSTSILK